MSWQRPFIHLHAVGVALSRFIGCWACMPVSSELPLPSWSTGAEQYGHINVIVTLWQKFMQVWSSFSPLLGLNVFRAISVQDAALPWTMRNSKIAARSTMVDTSACPSPPVFPPVSLDRLSVEVIIETLLQFKFTPSLASAVSALTQCILSTQSASTLQLLNNPDVNICLSLAADIVLEASISEVSNKKVSVGDESLCQLYQQFTAINAKRRPSKDVLVIKLYIVPPTTVPCVNWTTTTGVKQMISPN